MFKKNKYTIWYNKIIDNAISRNINGYTELQHIIPKSLGGSNFSDNLVNLTAREHFICHWLLTKMTTGDAKAKMIFALNGMKRSNSYQLRYDTKITSRVFDDIKQKSAEQSKIQNTGNKLSEQHKKNISKSLKGKPKSELWKDKNRKPKSSVENMKGRIWSQESITKISKALTGRKLSEEHKQKLGKRSDSDEWKRKLSVSATNRIKTHCPYCNKLVTNATLSQWHGDKCKFKEKG